ncbi:MAG: phosphoribosylamine--glycine ligase [Bacteroidota bacterium]
MINCLLIGSGGREHALAEALLGSTGIGELYVAPGNAGTARDAKNISIPENDFPALSAFILQNKIGLVLVGPEIPLINGIADYLRKIHGPDLIIVGPTTKGAQLEGSKAFSKKLMQDYGIPTAAFREFSRGETQAAKTFLRSLSPPFVIKADGPAAGKGVVICDTQAEAETWIHRMLEEAVFGASSSKVVIEQFIKGTEVSVFFLTDGQHYLILPEAKDYKRIGDQDSGPNTGGMGSVSPVVFYTPALAKKVEEKIIRKTLRALQQENIAYMGFIFLGLMIDEHGEPWVIEYNCRMGDPETQSVMARIQPDWINVFSAMHRQRLHEVTLQILPCYVVSVVMAAKGYPGNYPTGMEIKIPSEMYSKIRFAGVTLQNQKLLTKGGRVISANGVGNTLDEAIKEAYAICEQVDYEDHYYRKDIGNDLLILQQKNVFL